MNSLYEGGASSTIGGRDTHGVTAKTLSFPVDRDAFPTS